MPTTIPWVSMMQTSWMMMEGWAHPSQPSQQGCCTRGACDISISCCCCLFFPVHAVGVGAHSCRNVHSLPSHRIPRNNNPFQPLLLLLPMMRSRVKPRSEEHVIRCRHQCQELRHSCQRLSKAIAPTTVAPFNLFPSADHPNSPPLWLSRFGMGCNAIEVESVGAESGGLASLRHRSGGSHPSIRSSAGNPL